MSAKKVNDSKTTMTELVMPNDTNPLHNLMGGNLMRWMDVVAGVCAGKHCEAHVVTASVDHVSFTKPIYKGDIVTLESAVTRTFNSSLEVYVEVFAADMFTRFDREGLFSTSAGMDYRKYILEPGGSHEPDVLIKKFLVV